MSIEGNKFGFNQNELKNNNFNPELNKFLENNELSKEEADVLSDMFEENKSGIILVSKENLLKLRNAIGSKSKVNYITTKDKQKISAITENNHITKKEKNNKISNNHISQDGFLKNVTKVRLDEIVGPSEKIKFSIQLSNNSLYKNNMDGKQYNVIWSKDYRNGKQTYVFENGPQKGKRVMISNGDRLLEYQDIKINKQNKSLHKETTRTIEYKNISEKNKAFIEKLKLPENYKKIAYEFTSKLRTNEILTKNTPIALVDGSKKEMLYTVNGKKIIVPILIGKKGLTSGGYKPNDLKTPKGKIHRFNPDLSRIANSVNGDASNSQRSKTVKSASLQSDLSNSFGGRYFHGVAQYRIDGRFNGMGTWGCVGVDVHTIRKMYYDVKKNGKGYGYVG